MNKEKVMIDGYVFDANSDARSLIAEIFLREIIENNITFWQDGTWPTEGKIDDIKDFSPRYHRSTAGSGSGNGDEHAIFDIDDTLVLVQINYGNIWVKVASSDKKRNSAVIEKLRDLFPQTTYSDDKVPIKFWYFDNQHGAMNIVRRIDVPTWQEIRGNYHENVAKGMDEMTNGFKPSHGGQLIVWHGLPGTGKTYSLRALANSWKEWAQFHYISDPEEFFHHAGYMHRVLLSGEDMEYDLPVTNNKKIEEEKWHVLILEDTGEILATDAKEKTGQALSRLLNIVDGLIGQGLKILVLVTTNEELKKMHPAVTRPGRCAVNLEFEKLVQEEVAQWFKDRGIDKPVPSSLTLAEMYAEAENYQSKKGGTTKNIGFSS